MNKINKFSNLSIVFKLNSYIDAEHTHELQAGSMRNVPNLLQVPKLRLWVSLGLALLSTFSISALANGSKAPSIPYVHEDGSTELARGHLYPSDSFIEGKENFKSCYRWMGKKEYKKWTDDSAPVIHDMSPREALHLNRYNSREKGKTFYCWLYPLGSLRGGLVENYGKKLLKINFVEDRVLFNRNTRKYSTLALSEAEIPETFKQDVDSEVVYANYRGKSGSLWFQEIMVKDASAVESFESIDRDLLQKLERELGQILSFANLPFRHFHFFYNRCMGKPNPEHRKWHSTSERNYACQSYRDYAVEVVEELSESLENDPLAGRIWMNSESRGRLKTAH